MEPDSVVVSRQNPRVKELVRLRDRAFRDHRHRMLIEGYRELRRALESGHPLEAVYFCPAMFQGGNEPDLLRDCRDHGAELVECAAAVFSKIAYRDRPEGVLAVAPPAGRSLDALPDPDDALVLVVEAIEKPGNLGTMLRTADAAGATAVVVCDPCTDLNNPNVVRASLGTLFTLPVAVGDQAAVWRWLKERAFAIMAASPHADDDYDRMDMTVKTALLLGSEQYGLSEFWMRHATRTVRIPMAGYADSLNVAAAATVLLFEAVRQRRRRQ